MRKHAKIPLDNTRRVVLICIALLSFFGFLTEWLLCGKGFWNSLAATALPAVPGALMYVLEYRSRLLERTFQAVKDLKLLVVALPVLLACLGIQLHEPASSMGTYWILGFVVCAYFIQLSLYRDPDLSCAALLLTLLAFYGLSWHLDLYAGGPLVIGFLVYPLSIRMMTTYYETKDDPDSRKKHILFLIVCVILTVTLTGGVIDKMLFGTIAADVDAVFSACTRLLLSFEPYSTLTTDVDTLVVLRSNYAMGYLAAIYGKYSGLPILLVMGVLLFAASKLAHSNRNMAPLALGCYYLLIFRAVDDLLTFFQIELGLTGAFPFFAGSMADRTVDFLLAAVVLMPLKPAKLSSLEPEDPDFDAQEEASLTLLPRDMDGLVQLCRYIFSNATERGWQLLFEEYQELMDANSLRIMVLRANSIFDTDYFRRKFPVFFRIAGATESLPLPKALQTRFTNNSFIDADHTYETNGDTLARYWGLNAALLIPPCWRAIGMEAMASNLHLRAVSIPHTVRRICFGAFRNCLRLRYVELRDGLEEIGAFAFSRTGLKKVDLPSSLQIIEHSAFAETALERVRVPGTVCKIGAFAFEKNPHLRSVVLEEGVSEIGECAFRDCPELRHIHIPDTVTRIHSSAFEGCTALRSVDASARWKNNYPDLLLSCLDQELQEEYGNEG